MMYNFAQLEDSKLDKIKALEGEIGTPLLAFRDYQPECARLDREKLAKIKKVEEELGVVLLAVKDQ